MFKGKIKLGQTVRDTVTGYVGVVVCRSEWLHGCVRVAVQGPVDKDGKMPDAINFDEPGLEVVPKAKAKTDKSKPPAGPRADDPGRSVDRR